ncbi:MAG: TauD/TfdA family dioxygenase [Novosphingobium sp.]
MKERGAVSLPADIASKVTGLKSPDGIPPLFIEAKPGAFASVEQAADWVDENRPTIDRLIEEHGVIVLRGFPLQTTADFGKIGAPFPVFDGNYQGGAAARRSLDKGVYEATQRTGDQTIYIHQEMFYVRDYPPRIAFFARKVAEKGGETLIADMAKVTRNLPLPIRKKLEEQGVLVIRNFAAPTQSKVETRLMDRRGWDFAFYTDSQAEVDEVCRHRGMEPHWHDDGSLTVFSRLPAFVVHPATGKEFYRTALHTNARTKADREKNEEAKQLLASQKIPSAMVLGNGEPLSPEEELALAEVVDDATIYWKWQQGDVMIVDNLQIGHGRNPFEGERATDLQMFN